jgi:hypothetical protein
MVDGEMLVNAGKQGVANKQTIQTHKHTMHKIITHSLSEALQIRNKSDALFFRETISSSIGQIIDQTGIFTKFKELTTNGTQRITQTCDSMYVHQCNHINTRV